MAEFGSSPLLQAWRHGRPGVGAGLLYAALGGCALWIASLAFFEPAQEATMRRFHLASGNFPVWAVQQVSPAMYNFTNEGWGDSMEHPMEELALKSHPPVWYFNHFPVRNLTWAYRKEYLPDGGWGCYRTRFRNLELLSKYHLRHDPAGGWHVELVESKLAHGNE